MNSQLAFRFVPLFGKSSDMASILEAPPTHGIAFALVLRSSIPSTPSLENTAMKEHAIDTLNSLLRGEIAATETYQQALEKLGSDPRAMNLRQIHDDHREAANVLRKHVHSNGGQPDQDSGAWGAFAKLVEGTATVFGSPAAIKALKEGEEHGQSEYEQAVNDVELPTECRTLISSTLLPQTKNHVATLQRLLA